MLKPTTDRLDFGDSLRPPVGYKTEFAIGTSYSLDMESLAAVCALLGLDIDMDSKLAQMPVHLLEAIRRSSDKFLLLCEGGQIKTPAKPNRLFSLLEDCVCEINLKDRTVNGKKINKPSFHPKFWFIKYEKPGSDPKYRMIVGSRNLTQSRDWDAGIILESVDTKDDPFLITNTSTPVVLGNFIYWLAGQIRMYGVACSPVMSEKIALMRKLSNEIGHIRWKKYGKTFEGFDFHTFGFDGRNNYSDTNSLFDKYHELFIITPFLSKGIMEQLSKSGLKDAWRTLITRRSELYKLTTELMTDFETFVLKDVIVDGEDSLSENEDAQRNDIHAKIYLKTRYSDSELYIGSANASERAFGGNVECLLKLYGKRRYMNAEMLRHDLFGDDEKKNPFELMEAKDYMQNDTDAIGDMLNSAIKDFCRAGLYAVIEGSYDVTVFAKTQNTDVRLYLAPMMKEQDKKRVSGKMTWERFSLADLSQWYILTAKHKGKELTKLIKIQTENMPDERESAIFGSIVKDKNTFLEYVAFLLGNDWLTSFLENEQRKNSADFTFDKAFDTPAVYEQMLKAVATAPEKLTEIRDMMNRLSRFNAKAVPKDFEDLFIQFEKAVTK